MTALRRPKAEGRGWYLERIDLASGERRWLAGEVDTLVRPGDVVLTLGAGNVTRVGPETAALLAGRRP